MKSILTSSCTLLGMGRGCNNPEEAAKSGLHLWQMFLVISFQKNNDLICTAITSRPKCPPNGESCNHLRINSRYKKTLISRSKKLAPK